MKKFENTKYNLYVTDLAPNGTNDLLVCDENHQIVGVVESAAFGIDVTRFESPHNKLFADDSQIFSVRTDEVIESLLGGGTMVRQIELPELKRKLCVSPIDPNGESVIRALKKFGIELEGIQ